MNYSKKNKSKKMKIEIVDFYPFERSSKNNIGTMHIYVIDLDMDIRGIQVIRNKNAYLFFLPKKIAFEGDKKVWYPIINFTNNAKNIELNADLRQKGAEFMQNWMKKDKK